MTVSLSTRAEISACKSAVYNKHRNNWLSLLFPIWGYCWIAYGVMCTAGGCKLHWNSVKQSRSGSLLYPHILMRDQKQQCWHIKIEVWWRDQAEFLLYWFGMCPMPDLQKPCCLINYFNPSLWWRRAHGLWGAAWIPAVMKGLPGCHSNLIGWCLIGILWLNRALVAKTYLQATHTRVKACGHVTYEQ